MDYEDMKHKMVPMHRDFLRRMLAVNEVPEPVMVRYFSLKKYLDKLSAPLSVMDLLRIAMDCGFNPDTGLFGDDKFDSHKPIIEEVVEEAEITAEEASPDAKRTEIELDPIREDGEQVTVYVEGDAKQGVIKGHNVTPGGVNYEVVIDGETLEINEDDIE
jgi:hypothetical protein